MYFLIDDTGSLTAFKKNGEACRHFCLKYGEVILAGGDPVVRALELNNGTIPTLNISALLVAISESDDPKAMALEARRAVEDYYDR